MHLGRTAIVTRTGLDDGTKSFYDNKAGQVTLPVQDVMHLGRTAMVTRTGLETFPPQSCATTLRT